MTRSERRLLIETGVTGIALTLLIVLLDYFGALFYPEQFLYDIRARYCQAFNLPPTDKLVHVDIDDGSLEAIGVWPWPRSKMGEIIDEINLAGAKALATDIIYPEPAPYAFDNQALSMISSIGARQAATTAPTTVANTKPATRTATTQTEPVTAESGFIQIPAINNDEVFAGALARFGKGIVPVSFYLNKRPLESPVYLALIDELQIDLELSEEALVGRLQRRGVKSQELATEVKQNFFLARPEAIYRRVATEVGSGNPTFEQLRARILPKTDPQIGGSVLLRLLKEQQEHYLSIRTMQRFARPATADIPPLLTTEQDQITIRPLIEASASTGFVDMVTMSDGIVRTLPLFVNHRGWVYPQMGLALACQMLGANPNDARLYTDRVVIPRSGLNDIVIPVHNQITPRGEYAVFFDIPWFGEPGGDRWMTMYDPEEDLGQKMRKKQTQHMSIQFIWEACEMRHHIVKNNALAYAALISLNFEIDQKIAEQLDAHPPDFNDPDSLTALIGTTTAKLKKDGTIEFYQSLKPEGLTPDERLQREKILAAATTLAQLAQQIPAIKAELAARRVELRGFLHDKAAMMGWIASGMIADYVPTSLHPRCPGVVAHGVIFNAIMTNNFWRRVPQFVTLLITASLGLLTTAFVAGLGTWRAVVATALMAIIYLLFNGFYLFDKHNLIVGVAGPLAVIVSVWAGGTLARYLRESQLRAHVTRSFSKRVDPALVSYVLEHDAKLDGQERELTVVFTDLAGFTTLSESLREKTVPLLNEYMGGMVPLIRKHKGYLNKFLGDGIMYFFGAPFENPAHAYCAVASVLEMQQAMAVFNRSLTERKLPNLSVRAGISSGMMVVGDAGSADTSDYTVLGDSVNLGARLEAANKVFGSRILLNDRARELIGERVIMRPIGKIQVVGKTKGVMTFEALSLAETATDAERQLAALTHDVVTSFMNGLFDNCLVALARLEAGFGSSKLVLLYRLYCERYLKEPPPSGFDGQIVLSEK
jgi:class 3 adenylate cyclase